MRSACALTSLIMVASGGSARAEVICATRYSDLGRTSRLETVQSLFQGGEHVGLVNQTQGTYVQISAVEDSLRIAVFTSGILDLYPIHREGPLQFCDDGRQLVMSGVGRQDKVVITAVGIAVGPGGARLSFRPGPMPELLRKLHRVK